MLTALRKSSPHLKRGDKMKAIYVYLYFPGVCESDCEIFGPFNEKGLQLFLEDNLTSEDVLDVQAFRGERTILKKDGLLCKIEE